VKDQNKLLRKWLYESGRLIYGRMGITFLQEKDLLDTSDSRSNDGSFTFLLRIRYLVFFSVCGYSRLGVV